jgi:hypothetical protein
VAGDSRLVTKSCLVGFVVCRYLIVRDCRHIFGDSLIGACMSMDSLKFTLSCSRVMF